MNCVLVYCLQIPIMWSSDVFEFDWKIVEAAPEADFTFEINLFPAIYGKKAVTLGKRKPAQLLINDGSVLDIHTRTI